MKKSRILTVLRCSLITLILAGSFLLMLYNGLQKWPDIIVDYGAEAYIAWRLAEGEVLYKDIIYVHGPLSPYVNGIIFRIFGVSIMNLVFFNIVIIFILIFLLFRIILFLADLTTAVVACTVFITIFAFSQYVGIGNYNYVTPYLYNLTYGITLSLFLVYIYILCVKRERLWYLFLIGVVLGFIFMTKIEVFISIFVAVLICLFLLFYINRFGFLKYLKYLTLLLVGFFLPVIIFTVYFSFFMPIKDTLHAVTFMYKSLPRSSISANIFYKSLMGLNTPWQNVREIICMLYYYLLVLFFLWASTLAIKKVTNRILKIIVTLALIVIVIIKIPAIYTTLPWLELCRPFSLILFLLITYLLFRIWRFRNDRQKVIEQLPVLVLSIFSLMLLLKMILNAHIYHYGFALAMPATMLIIALMVYFLPHLLGRDNICFYFARMIGILLLITAIVAHVNISNNIYKLKTLVVGSGGDRIFTFDPKISPRGAYIKLALEIIRDNLGSDETFIVIPEGIMLNYLSRHANPCPYTSFMPFEFKAYGETEILKSLSENAPDYVVIVDKNISEWGLNCFGKDYGRKFYKWIKKHYKPIYKIGEEPFSGNGFGVIIAKAKENK